MKSNQISTDVEDALKKFFIAFGTIDEHTQIALEEFFKELLNEKSSLHLSGETGQKGNQSTDSI